jgi:hypothetical protein
MVKNMSGITRKEKDTYVITKQDTTVVNYNKNSPENAVRGTVYPSTKETIKEHSYSQKDSVVLRKYPDFIRLGVFESVGFIGGSDANSLNAGIFGTYLPVNISDSFSGNDGGGIFNGGLYRFGIFEKRLRWFKDSPNWTWGMHGFEMFMPNAQLSESLVGVMPFYLRKRWFVSDKIPYQTITAHIGINWLGAISTGVGGSPYLNLAGSYDVGSIGGFNARAYLGMAIGSNSQNTLLTFSGNELAEGEENTSPAIFYAGLGVSLLDFHNKVPETYEEWKDMEHSAWSLGFLRLGMINAFTDYSITDSDDNLSNNEGSSAFLTGISISLLNTDVGLPIFNNKFYVGTSLLNIILAGRENQTIQGANTPKFIGSIGILPIRVGYWQELWQSASVSPFIEYNYYPSSVFHLGAKVNLVFPPLRNHHLSIVFGYLNGDPLGNVSNDILGDISGDLSDFTKISNFYVGISIGLYDRIFYEEELRYFK